MALTDARFIVGDFVALQDVNDCYYVYAIGKVRYLSDHVDFRRSCCVKASFEYQLYGHTNEWVREDNLVAVPLNIF